MNTSSIQNYTVRFNNHVFNVPQKNSGVARKIDQNNDGYLSTREIRDFVSKPSQDEHHSGNVKDRTNEFKCALAAVKNPYAAGYHSFDALIKDFDKLAQSNPNHVQKVVLGKTAEGRELIGYKLSEGAQGDTSHKPGVVITGCHHAREWMTVEAPLVLAHRLLDGIATDPTKQKRLKDAEVWILPCVNPDGYEYSRETDNMWRKNRSVAGVDQLGHPTSEVGVDINRNYGDNKPGHEWIFRPAGDLPGVTTDDFGATSDNPASECYRGLSAASELETQALTALEDGHKNIMGCIDFHSYSDDILYPWSHTAEHPPHYDIYQQIGGKVAAATGYKLEQSIGLYPNSGSSDEFQEANGLVSFTFEMGKSFQPNPKKIPEIAGKAAAGSIVFIDEILAHAQDGSLPARV